MPKYDIEAKGEADSKIKETIDAPTEAEARQAIRRMGYYVTKISVRQSRADKNRKKPDAAKRIFPLDNPELGGPIAIEIRVALGADPPRFRQLDTEVVSTQIQSSGARSGVYFLSARRYCPCRASNSQANQVIFWPAVSAFQLDSHQT